MIKALGNEKCKRDPRDELSYSFRMAFDVTFRARRRRTTFTSRDRHSDKMHFIMASCISHIFPEFTAPPHVPLWIYSDPSPAVLVALDPEPVVRAVRSDR